MMRVNIDGEKDKEKGGKGKKKNKTLFQSIQLLNYVLTANSSSNRSYSIKRKKSHHITLSGPRLASEVRLSNVR